MKHLFLKTSAALLFSLHRILAADSSPAPSYLGIASCSSSSCHGGSADNKNQCVVWSRLDFHSRSFATLNTARSERLAETLKINKASASERCTGCHAPFQAVPESLRAPGIEISHGVSCENCHGPAQNWIRSHTRADFTHSDRVADGMTDLRNLRNRAGLCVNCHQVVDKELLAAGHPELIFELDGQSATQPRHWKEKDEFFHPKTWVIGQAVALREISRQLASDSSPSDSLLAQWHALSWLVGKIASLPLAPESPALSKPPAADIEKTLQAADRFANSYSQKNLTSAEARALFSTLLRASSDFQIKAVPQKIQARRAERLVLGIDRLTIDLPQTELNALNPKIKTLFQQVQSLPDFQSAGFAESLESLSKSVR